MITLQVNGDAQQCAAGLALPDFLTQMGVNPALVVVEYNGDIVPRQQWPGIVVQEGDRLEIVTIVGGG